MTSKIQAIVVAWIAGITAFISWVCTIPPEQQTSLLGPLVELVPIHYRDSVGGITRLLASASTVYAVYKAAHSGPQTPPPNSPK